MKKIFLPTIAVFLIPTISAFAQNLPAGGKDPDEKIGGVTIWCALLVVLGLIRWLLNLITKELP